MTEGVSPQVAAAPSKTVCIVDDDASIRTALRRLFLSAGLTVATFASAEEFLREADGTAGCVVADVHLGGMNGLELQAALIRRGDALPMILISGVASEEMEAEALRLGAIAFLRKPFNAGTLLDTVLAALGIASTATS